MSERMIELPLLPPLPAGLPLPEPIREPDPPRPTEADTARDLVADLAGLPEDSPHAAAIRRARFAETARDALAAILERGDASILVKAGGVSTRHWTMGVLAWMFGDVLRETGAENYLVMDVNPPDGPRLQVTIQVARGTTPAEKIAALEAEVAALKSQLETKAATGNPDSEPLCAPPD